MEHVYIDTALLAVPNYAVDQDTASELIERVVHFAALVEPEVPLRVVLSSNAEEELWAHNSGPGYDEIEQFVDLMAIRHLFSARDLTVLYQALLDRSVRSDAICPIEVQEFENFQAAPLLPAEISPVGLTPETRRILSTLTAINTLEPGWHFGSSLSGPGGQFGINTTVLSAFGPQWEALGPLPITISANVQAVAHVRELITQEVSQRIWANAETPEELHLAITFGALDALRRTGEKPDPNALVPFSIGPSFLDSLSASQCAGTGRYSGASLELCCQLISRTCNRAIGQLGKPAQQRRASDGALAWRVHLTKGHEALRLMYWQKGHEIEFANVGVKHELEIAAGRAGAAVCPDYIDALAIC